MNEKKIQRMANKDAEMWLSAEMFYGDGAGVRRRHAEAEIATKVENMTGYHEAFERAYASLDKNKFAKLAIKERKQADRMLKNSKNLRAIKNGNLNNLSTGVFFAVGIAYVAHQTGYDKKIWAATKDLYAEAKAEVIVRKERRKTSNVYNITNISEGQPAEKKDPEGPKA